MGEHCLRDLKSNRLLAGMLLFNICNINLTNDYFNNNLGIYLKSLLLFY